MILFIKLLLAHLLGDFIFQPDSWVRKKELRKYKSIELYLHGLIHFLLVIILLAGHPYFILIACTIAITHILIDLLKIYFQSEKYKRQFFIVDQFLHLVVMLLIVYFVTRPDLLVSDNIKNHLVILITGIVVLLTPSSVIVKLILSKWAPSTEISSDKIETKSLLHAGKMIGFLERLLVFVFILANQWSAIGFLVTAKSVFRFSDLKIGQDRKLTEYILIGTLLSFGIAIITGLITSILFKLNI